MQHSLPLSGKTALVTGVSRRRGIGFSVSRKLASLGASIVIHHHQPHDERLPWGGDNLDAVRDGIRCLMTDDALFRDVSSDLTDVPTISVVLDAAYGLTGNVDIVVCNHARSGDDGSILDMTPDRLDAFWNTNTRSTILLTAEYARRVSGLGSAEPLRPGDPVPFQGPFDEPVGRVFWMTSGQIHGAMPGEVAYATSKAALAGVTKTVAAELMRVGITLNTIDPGPVNTGYLDADKTDRELAALHEYMETLPFGRFGAPSDPAELIGWLASPGGQWVVGQILTSDGGFSLG
ncbi:SDR family oxidoreductase [Paramicrobacterium chengjingii]|uniref:SDR family oxidoreductase n=1 Tax=Paramicrobacterium chengjingii TaxID=2769067 RepID=A0ABX6YK62_9MICO|nr:SDR family oxidoreductase [Microbacterium chengjingii]QPZ39110.1 SDR family oxidoreductase [Microbacterium chengjingii]